MKMLISRLLFMLLKGGLISLFLSLIKVRLGFWTVTVVLVYLAAVEIDRMNREYEIKEYIARVWRKYNGTVNK